MNEIVDSLIPDYEIVSLLDRNQPDCQTCHVFQKINIKILKSLIF